MNYINLILDTTPPSNPAFEINNGVDTTNDNLVDLSISMGDIDSTGYQMLIWGDVDASYNSNIDTSESESSWISFTDNLQIRTDNSDGQKYIYLKIRDDVHNESSQVSRNIRLDTTIPSVTTTEPDVAKISEVLGKDVATFSFMSDKDFVEYKVKVVSNINGLEDTGVLIGVENGSKNTSDTGEFEQDSAIVVTINGKDLNESSNGDGNKIIKVFVKDLNNTWST